MNKNATLEPPITDDELRVIMPLLPAKLRATYLPYLQAAMREYGITTRKRAATFLSQLAHESTDLSRWIENLNYSTVRLTEVFRKYFPNIATAAAYAHDPQRIANRVYANRMGNGAASSGDGYKFRGRCPMQATGRDMYAWLAEELNLPLVENPDLLLQPEHGFRAAAAIFAKEKNCNRLADGLNGTGNTADLKQYDQITRAINGGYNGRDDRRMKYKRALKVLPNFRFEPTQTPAASSLSAPVPAPQAASNIQAAPQAGNLFATSAQPPQQPASITTSASDPVESFVDDVPTELATKAGRNVWMLLGARLGKVFGVYLIALQTGNLAVILSTFVLVVGLVWLAYKFRAHLKRGALAVWRKVKKESAE